MKSFYCYNCDKEYKINHNLNSDEKPVCPTCGEVIYELSQDNATSTNNATKMTDKDIQLEQLQSIRRIESMMNFFVVLTVINIIVAIISAMSIR